MITTFGETMLRISPALNSERIEQALNYRIEAGGSESNVAVALSNLGIKSQFVTSLPDNELGKKIIRNLQYHGVETDNIKFADNRIGIYWTENGVGPRRSYVIYDRDESAFSKSSYDDYKWENIFKSTSWFHFSGISPAVSGSIAELLELVVKNCGCPYSVDLNYREKLWNWLNKEQNEVSKLMSKLCENATLIAGNETDFMTVFNIDSSIDQDDKKFMDIAKKAFGKFKRTRYIAISNRKSVSATKNDWSGYLFVNDGEITIYKGSNYQIDTIADRVGTGDSFVAGIIYGLIKFGKNDYQKTVDFATTLAALNHTTHGDASTFSSGEVLATMHSKGSGRIIR